MRFGAWFVASVDLGLPKMSSRVASTAAPGRRNRGKLTADGRAIWRNHDARTNDGSDAVLSVATPR